MMQSIDLPTFADIICEAVTHDQQMAFFLGAGCSVSSGVLPASTLCLNWIREMKQREEKRNPRLGAFGPLQIEEWYRKYEPDFTLNQAGKFYSSTIKRRFPNPALRRMEAQRFVAGADPAIGYAVLASLMADSRVGRLTNVVLTTNFDDLVYDALSIFYNVRPLVISHGDLAKFAIPPIERPLVLKLHGDAVLEPLHTPEETSALAKDIASSMDKILSGRGLIFMGYSGGDEGITKILNDFDKSSLRNGVYWVNQNLPSSPSLLEWLIKRESVWVTNSDFDTTMIALGQSFKLAPPPPPRFKQVYERLSDFSSIAKRKLAASSRRSTSKTNLDRLRKELYKELPDASVRQEVILREVGQHPRDPYVRGYYAQHLVAMGLVKEGFEQYQLALELDPDNVEALCHMAGLLIDFDVRSQTFDDRVNEAERLLRRACFSYPRDPRALGTLASFMWTRRGDKEASEALFQRALQADPNNVETVASYANFIWRARGFIDEALAYYNDAIKLNPHNMRIMANMSQILFIKDDGGRACRYAERVLSQSKSKILQLETAFYLFVFRNKGDKKKYLAKLKELIELGVRSPGWDLEASVSHAEKIGKKTLMIDALSKVITRGSPAIELSEFVEWQSI